MKFVVNDFLKSGEAGGFPAGSVMTTEQPGVVAVTGKQPGFLQCQVSFDAPDGKKLQAVAGAGFSPTKIGLSLPVPDDFDAFWTIQKKLLAAVPLEPQLTRADQPGMKGDLECFDVQIKCLGDAPVSGYFARPTNAKPKSLPAILWVHGAGVRSSAAGNAIQGAKHGMLSLDINAHGIPNGKPNEFYAELSN
ncbi:MAG: axeA, partial [Planctomycetota bacterium]